MSNVLLHADELRNYYNFRWPYNPNQSNPGIFLGPPVDKFKVELLSESHNRHEIKSSHCSGPADCRGRFSHDKGTGTAMVEALGNSKPGKYHQNILYLTYSIDFRLDLPVLLHPVHSISFFPHINVALDWDVSAPGSNAKCDVHTRWTVVDGTTGKEHGTRGWLLKEVTHSNSGQTNAGTYRNYFPPYARAYPTPGLQLYRCLVPLKLKTTFRLLFTVSAAVFAFGGSKCRSKADVFFSSPA